MLTRDEIEDIARMAWSRMPNKPKWDDLGPEFKRERFDIATDIINRGGANGAYEEMVAACKAEYVVTQATKAAEKVVEAAPPKSSTAKEKSSVAPAKLLKKRK